MTSGAIQYGVPTSDFLLFTSVVTWAQKPKSDNFTWKASDKGRDIKYVDYWWKSITVKWSIIGEDLFGKIGELNKIKQIRQN